jgi:hypothetical protein
LIMNLAAILGLLLLLLGSATANAPLEISAFVQQETPSAQNSGNSSANSSSQAAAPNKRSRHKKTAPPDCTNAPAPLNTQPGTSPGSTNESGNTEKTPQPASAETENTKPAGPAHASASNSAASKPCPPTKKVVRNGGSSEPAIKLTGDAAAGEAAEQRSTEQLASTAEANLKKINERELQPNQKDTVNQIQQFLQESKAATAAGNLELAHNFAQKAQLLSEELANAKQ